MERLSEEEVHSGNGYGHLTRYMLAAGLTKPGDVVLDMACGIGYGRDVIGKGREYYAVDQIPKDERVNPDAVNDSGFRVHIEADLEIWEPGFHFDVGISFETIEHLDDYSNLVGVLKQARKWIIISVPTVPTKHMNEWHKHDFTSGQLWGVFMDSDWEMFQTLGQPSEFSEIYIFKRKKDE